MPLKTIEVLDATCINDRLVLLDGLGAATNTPHWLTYCPEAVGLARNSAGELFNPNIALAHFDEQPPCP